MGKSKFNEYVHARYQPIGGRRLSDEDILALSQPMGGYPLTIEAINQIHTPLRGNISPQKTKE